MQLTIDQRLEEIRLCTKNEDLNRAGQRLMDLTYDYSYSEDFRKEAVQLRKKYNEGRQLGLSGYSTSELQSAFENLIVRLTDAQPSAAIVKAPGELVGRITSIAKNFQSRLHNFQFQPISIDLTQGKIIGLVGQNGNGKTTLLRMIAGDLATDSGSIEYYLEGNTLTDWQEIKRKIAFIPQRLERWYGNAYDRISFEAAIKGFKDEKNIEKVEFIIHRMGLTNFRELTWTQLSSGYKLRFEIAMALAWEPAVLILDEPLANLDIQAQELLLQDLRNLADSLRNPVSIILSSQQLHEVETVADQVIFLKNGHAVFNGSLHEFRKGGETNTFEIQGEFTYQQLSDLLQNWKGIRIEQSASAFTVTCDASHTREELLELLVKNKMGLDYFRNITGSTKKLFSDKY